ncbi:unnamed protein product [Staurois parvus]|uniref:Uncharacterized protein n=1 Tax=Staurois parvus TaxID=386267 RepID=A0ABN9BA90_9NEOB|nr:unnamed protein product [Staurois parvus]
MMFAEPSGLFNKECCSLGLPLSESRKCPIISGSRLRLRGRKRRNSAPSLLLVGGLVLNRWCQWEE